MVVPLVRSSSGHVYVSMDIGQHTFFSVAQVQRLHRQFYHPSAEKLFQLLRKARPEDVTPETLKVLEDLGKRCDPCQRIQTAPVRFKVSFGAEHVRFNERIMMDVMSIDGAPILPVRRDSLRSSTLPTLRVNQVHLGNYSQVLGYHLHWNAQPNTF